MAGGQLSKGYGSNCILSPCSVFSLPSGRKGIFPLLISCLWVFPDGVAVLDEQERLLACNQQMEEYLKDITGRFWSPGEKLEGGLPFVEECQRVIRGGKGLGSGEYEIGGRRFSFRCGLLPPELVTIRSALLVLRDTTEEHRIREQFLRASKLASLGELAGGIAHEINNPLQAVLGFIELALQDKSLSEKTARRLSHALEAGRRATEIVHNLLSFTRRQRQLGRKHVNPTQLLHETLLLVQKQFRKENVELHIEPKLPLGEVELNASALQQVVLNLVQNARDAVVDRGGPGHIWVRLHKSNSFMTLEVEDNGPGIPPEIEHRIFEPLFSTKDKGSGLGLTLVRRLVEEMSGRISLENRPGHGAKFIVEIPL